MIEMIDPFAEPLKQHAASLVDAQENRMIVSVKGDFFSPLCLNSFSFLKRSHFLFS